MNLEEVNQMWSIDCKIDETNITQESKKIPVLHNKYYTLYVKEHLRTKKFRSELVELERAKFEWYAGTLSQEELIERGWKQNPLKILRSDINKHVESDKDIITLSLKIDYHASIEKYLEDIIKQINTRNFILKNIIEWERFRSGGM